ncbi:MAG: cytochrome c-type biogenesis protein CcmH [Myxococcales bacterium]|nr:cytochrome c-type biogenesis protein CcmH [Myxococcales bacterium]
MGLITLVGCEAHDFSSGTADAAAKILGVDLKRPQPVPKEIVEKAKVVGREVVCLCGTCPRRLVANCECGWARQNQHTIQYALMQGKTSEQIVNAFTEAHGLKSLPHPPATAFGRLSWALPFGGAALTLLLLTWYGLRLRSEPELVPVPTQRETVNPEELAVRKRLEQELDELEDE